MTEIIKVDNGHIIAINGKPYARIAEMTGATDRFEKIEDGAWKWYRHTDVAVDRMRMEMILLGDPTFTMVPAISYNGNGWGNMPEYIGDRAEDGTPWSFASHRSTIPACTYSENKDISIALMAEPNSNSACSLYKIDEGEKHVLIFPEEEKPQRRVDIDTLDETERRIFDYMKPDVPMLCEEIAEGGFELSQVMVSLTLLEIAGAVEAGAGGYYPKRAADFGGVRQNAKLDLLPDAEIGDYVLIHAGYAIEKLSEQAAKESLESWDELLEMFQRNRIFYKTGGITATGGEPMVQMDFLLELFTKAKEKEIHTCLDTSGIMFTEDRECEAFAKIEKLMQVTDLVMLDIKHIEDEPHRKLTGQSNQKVIAFAKYLDEIGKSVWIRHVVVPGITDEEKELETLGEFLKSLSNIEKLEVLPYHTLGENKYDNLGMEYPLKGVPQVSKEEANKAENIIRKSWGKELLKAENSKIDTKENAGGIVCRTC